MGNLQMKIIGFCVVFLLLLVGCSPTQDLIPSQTMQQNIFFTQTSSPSVLPSLTSTQTQVPTFTPQSTETPIPSNTPTSTVVPAPTLDLANPPRCNDIGQEWLWPVDGMTVVCIPSGWFEMGGIYADFEGPRHRLFLSTYLMDKTEVTNTQYGLCMAAGVCTPPHTSSSNTREEYFHNPEFSNYPVVMVDWNQAVDYCEWVGGSLPSEAQWEKAAGGPESFNYPWGNQDPDSTLAWINHKEQGDTVSVGTHPAGASPYGVLDMAGNVYEWVADWYQADYYALYPTTAWPNDPIGPRSGTEKSIRGGAYFSSPVFLRSAARSFLKPDLWDAQTGFRCVR